ncbi:ABC transporter ATP-binding protein [Chloroflexota bacterium]
MSDKDALSGRLSIETKGLTKSYGSQHALKGIDLIIREGERFVIFGPNGAGKTTLIKILAALARLTEGSVFINGMDIRRDQVKIRRSTGVVSHQTFLYNDLTVYENLKFYGKMYDVPDLEQRIHRITGEVQLGDCLHDRAGTLSRGFQQRASIARAIIHDPAIMLLDEPEVGLDSHAIELMRDILDYFTSERRTVVVTTHNLERGLSLCDKVAILNKGEVVYQSHISEIDTENFRETYHLHTGAGT